MFLVNSRLDRFTAAPSGSLRMEFTLPGRPFSRSYGANLPSSLTMVSSITSVFSTCAPVSVLVRARATSLDAFLGGMAFGTSRLAALGIPSQTCPADLPTGRPTRLPRDDHRPGSHNLPRPAIGDSGGYVVQEYQPVGNRLRLSASP